MKNTKIYWGAIAVVIAVSALLFNTRSFVDEPVAGADKLVAAAEPQNQPTNASVMSDTQAQTKAITPAVQQGSQEVQVDAPLQERLNAMQQRRPERNFDAAAVAAAMKRETAWSPAEETPDNLPLEPEELTDGRQFIQLDSLKIETLMPGDDVKVSIDETGQDYIVSMDRVEKHDYDSISWHGHIDGADGQTYSVSFTRGKDLTVGGLDTPDGHYVLQAHGNNGWIASSDLLFKVDPNVDDVMYPHDDGQQQEVHAH